LGYENFDNTNVTASSLMLFYYSGKESRLQEPYEFQESANILSSTSAHINREFPKPTTSMSNQEDKENSKYDNFVAASSLMLFHYSGKEGQLQELCEFPESANSLFSTSVYIKIITIID
jgi:hypothetical protein